MTVDKLHLTTAQKQALAGQRVLVLGGRGYIGSLLCKKLLEYADVLSVDVDYYAEEPFVKLEGVYQPGNVTLDIRDLTDLDGVDAVISLADLSNDPLGNLYKGKTRLINSEGQKHIIDLCQEARVKKFIYASSCSVYGFNDAEVNEESALNPQTEYANCKVEVENYLNEHNWDFDYTVLRFATAFGVSYNQRLDIAIPNLCLSAHLDNKVKLDSDGKAERPFCHIDDITNAIIYALVNNKLSNETFNVGCNENNAQIREIAELVSEHFDCPVEFGAGSPDTRSYRVNFDKLKKVLPADYQFTSVNDGVEEMFHAFKQVASSKETLRREQLHIRLARMQKLIKLGLVNEDLQLCTGGGLHL